MIVVIAALSFVVLVHVVAGQRALDNAMRLYDAVCARCAITPKKLPRSSWRHFASLFTALVSAPITGIFVLWAPRRRRPWLGLLAIGAAKQAWRRGAITEHHLVAFDRVVTSWVFRFGDALPEGRDIPDIDDIDG